MRAVRWAGAPVVKGTATTRQPDNPTSSAQRVTAPELIVVGCSLGGMDALLQILAPLTRGFCVPIAVVQHRHRKSNEQLPAFFRRKTDLAVVDAVDKQWIKPGHVYLAPADYHLLVERGVLNLSLDELVRFSRPSIDVLFESAADAYGAALLGIVLTGANEDGTRGAERIKRRGGTVIVQDPATAEAPVMPQSVIDSVAVDQILRLEEIAAYLIAHCPSAVMPRS